MARKQKAVKSNAPDEVTYGKKLRDWVSFVLALLGATLGLFGYINSRENASLTRRLEADTLLNEAWDLLGGREGSREIDLEKFIKSSYELEKAKRKIDRAKELAPEYAKVYWTESSLAYAKGQSEESIQLARKAIQLDPTSSIPHNKIGMVLASQEKFNEAADALKQAALLDSSDPAPHSNLCFIYWKLGKLNEASDECEQALKVDPSWRMTYENLAAVRLAQGRADDAQELLRKVRGGGFSEDVDTNSNPAQPNNGMQRTRAQRASPER
ncbi:MAG TPA: tetratricopeptide repeat protein [Pyrinomonadaceae bacterium]